MNAKTTIGRIIGKGGLKPGNSRADSGLEKGKQESAAPRKSMEEVATGKGKVTDPERSGLLQKILSLEKEKEKYNHLLGEKDREIQNLKDKLRSKTKNSEVSLLQNQLEEKVKEAERRERLLCSLSEEINRLKCNLSAVMEKCSDLENKASSSSQASQEAATDSTEIERQLKDALEKNQQWLLYDQQREAYVRGLLGRIFELEQKAEIVSQQESKSNSEGHLQEEKQEYYDKLLLTAKSNPKAERRTITQLRSELDELKKTYEETQGEMMTLSALLQSQRVAEMKTQENENKMKEKVQRLKQENEAIKEQLREEKEKSEDLLCQVQLLRKSLLRQEAEHTRITLLEQQIQICTTDLENGKLDRQNLKHELNHVLKELRKAKEKITRLEPLDMHICTLDWPSSAGETVWDTTFAVVFFLIPGFIIVISYSKILQITKASRRSLNAGLAYSEHHQIRVSQQDYKLFRSLFLLMISFFIMWSPIIVIIFLILVQNFKKDLLILPSVFFWIALFTFANSAVNPILYNVAYFRRKCQEILLCCTGNTERHGAGTETTARRSNREQPHLSFITR